MENGTEMGKRIRELRLQRSLTQEQLAKELSLTPQAVSKWENGSALPDTALLPQLSIVLGVTIDELFSLSEEQRMDRIDRMLQNEAFLSRQDFDSAERFLKDRLAERPQDGQVPLHLAGLYNHRAYGYRKKAEVCAKEALALIPTVKDAHGALNEAAGGALADWCCANHHELIDYYYGFIRRNPTYRPGYLWLLDNLIADGRFAEAEKAIENMSAVEYTYHVPLYRGIVSAAQGRIPEAEEHWKQMREEFPDIWQVWSSCGDAMARLCRYDEAIPYYEKSFTLQTPPRFTDNLLSIAHIRELQGRRSEAADAYERVLGLLREDWNDVDGAEAQEYRAAILRLRAEQ